MILPEDIRPGIYIATEDGCSWPNLLVRVNEASFLTVDIFNLKDDTLRLNASIHVVHTWNKRVKHPAYDHD